MGVDEHQARAGRALKQWGQPESSLNCPFSLSPHTAPVLPPRGAEASGGDTSPHSPGSLPTFPSQGSRGELLLSLCYNPSANSIIVNIIKARNLKAMDIGGTSGAGASRHKGGWTGEVLGTRRSRWVWRAGFELQHSPLTLSPHLWFQLCYPRALGGPPLWSTLRV